jgi:hypothetical protein
MQSIGVNVKTRKPRAAQAGELIGVRLQPDQLAALDRYRAAQEDVPTRPEALRRLAAQALRALEG